MQAKKQMIKESKEQGFRNLREENRKLSEEEGTVEEVCSSR